MTFPNKTFCVFLAAFVAAAAGAADWQRLAPGKFSQLPEVNARIDFARYDHELMAAAIFHETNRARQQLGLSPFHHLPKLDEAADTQASIGAMLVEVSHHNPLPSLADVSDRVRAVGLMPELVAENIALTPALDYDPETTDLGMKGTGATRKFLDLKTGRELESLTYAGFATLVVRQWMNSPGHRANLANPGLNHLGCSARWRKSVTGADLLYSVQVFFTPHAGVDSSSKIRKTPAGGALSRGDNR